MSEHVVKKSLYYGIFVALLIGTAVTVGVAYVPLPGNLNIIVALLIAASKASLVVLFFMHVKWSSRLTKMFVIIGIMWFALMIGITMTDYLSRSWLTYKP